ncbi:unnamed protein product [Chilo suppressalis]|uniref:Elongation of very long chain fatty acids protein n=1 Tax=Chilo suppressalis TaxID=168631 RepID=A0ABN8BC43_CHISP|nr:unnamed protein product [Chilo suppressalis]
MGSPLPLLTITVAYILLILRIGPDFMRSRAPMKLNNVLLVYNTLQVLVSLFLVKKGFTMLAHNGLLNYECTEREDLMKDVVTGIYYYLLAKLSELLDTVFFILRKKQRQVTFLHVYHHTIMLWNPWITLKYGATYTMAFLGSTNSFVHVIMYAYYGLSAFPSLAKYLWWKKYLTALQLTQFVLVFLHAVANHFYGCPLSTFTMSIILFNTTAFFILFGDFYIKSYSKNYHNKKTLEIEDKLSKQSYAKRRNLGQ